MVIAALQTLVVEGEPRLVCDSAGEGETVLFLHGIGGVRDNWTGELQALAAHRRAVAWDARGYGDSDDYDGDVSIEAFADDVPRVLNALGAPAAHLVGLSLGASIALEAFNRHPTRVRSLTLASMAPRLDRSLTPEAREDFVRLRQAPLLAGKTPADIAPAIARSLMGPDAGEAVFDRLTASIGRLHPASYLKTIAASFRYQRDIDLGSVSVPVLVLYGADDRLTPPELGRATAAELPDARLRIVERCGHLMNLEQPAVFRSALLEFLDVIDRR